MGNYGNSERFYFGRLQYHCRWWLWTWNLKVLVLWKRSYDQLRQHMKKHRHYFANSGPSSQSYGFSSSHVGCESWTESAQKAEHWRMNAFELWCWKRLLRVPWTERRSNQSILKEISSNIHWKYRCCSWNSNTLATWCEELTHWKDPDAGKNWRQEEKGTTEAEMVGWHHPLNGHECEQAPDDGQGSLVCCSPWGCKELDTLSGWTELNWMVDLQCCVHFCCTAQWLR